MEIVETKAYFGQKVNLEFKDDFIKFSEDDENALTRCDGISFYCGEGAELFLRESIGEGGEGTVYECSFNGFVAKIYKKEFRKVSTQRKIELLVKANPEKANPGKVNPGKANMCWPLDALYYKDKFVGFLMPKAYGKKLEVLTTGNDKRILSRYPKYTKDGQIRMILSILKNIEFLHSMNILLGDINAGNIMFNPDTLDITFVDMDCVQIGKFPCVTSSPGYDSLEVIVYRAIDSNGHLDVNIAKEKDKFGHYLFNNYYHNFYRTLENEYYAISVLLFNLMTDGCMPYSYAEYGFVDLDQGYEDIDLQINKSFPYSVDRESLNDNCSRKEIWSHMPSFIKKAFVDVFTGKKRHTLQEWIVLFEHYEKLLKEDRINDPQAHLAFAKDEIDYKNVDINLSEKYMEKGFSMSDAVERVMKYFKDPALNSHIKEVSEALKHKPVYIVDQYTFSLIYNIGILKKVKVETNL